MFWRGQKVVCVNADPHAILPKSTGPGWHNPLKEGAIYTIAKGSHPDPFLPGRQLVFLEEQRNAVPPASADRGYDTTRFRPLVDPIQQFRDLVANPQKELVT